MLERLGMKSNVLRVILDTNLWISFLISKRFQGIDNLIEQGIVRLIFSNELIEEFIEVVSRPKFKKYFSFNDIERIFSLFEEYGELVKVTSNINICRDKKDNFLLNLSIDSTCDFLITGDNDLLILKKIKNTKIVSIAEFMKIPK